MRLTGPVTGLLAAGALVGALFMAPVGERPTLGATTVVDSAQASPTTPAPAMKSPVPTTVAPAAERNLRLVDVIGGDIAAKSVVSTPTGLVFAQNMMYRHSITVYDESHSLLRSIDDTVDLAEHGVAGGEVVQGAPVEAAPTSDGRYVYVSNYAMYGDRYGDVGEDDCEEGDSVDDSFVYRVDASTLEIDQVIAVGAVPKYLAVAPDDSTMLVANWCSFDVSVIDLESGTETERVPIGHHPRGIAIDSSSNTAYVAIMGEQGIAVLDLETATVTETISVGDGPRHLLLDPTEQFLYVTLNRENRVVKLDIAEGEVVESVDTGVAPRTMDISPGGDALYVVNYGSNTLTKVLTDDFTVVGRTETGNKPIGVTYHPGTGEVWVSNYADGTIQVFDDAP